MDQQPILAVSGLSVVFRTENQEITATDLVSFQLNSSETLAIVGESGSGKSVTALSILRLIPCPPGFIRSGSVIFQDGIKGKTDLFTVSEKVMQSIRGVKISMIFQEPMTSLNPVYTCGEQVTEVLHHHFGMTRKHAKERVIELFDEVKLPRPKQLFTSYPHQLSGGQKQRVMIAMAISCNPRLLIADEPTTALDVTVQKSILELLYRLQTIRKMSILFITHDLGLVSGFADRVIVMYKGRVVEEGSVSEIFNHPKHSYTKGLIACRPPLNIRLKRLLTVEDFMKFPIPEQIIVSQETRIQQLKKIYQHSPILQVHGLCKCFYSSSTFQRSRNKFFKALDNIHFSVYPGETLGIVGESGSGKTTLARSVLELIPPSEGTITYLNTEITTLTHQKLKKLRKDLQIIFQDPYSSLNPRITVGYAIMEPMIVHGLHKNMGSRKENTLRLLTQVGLDPDSFDRYPHEFSGGQRQRICIARALAVEPRLIICDEPVSALDISVQAQVLNLLNDLKYTYGLTYIFISHDLSVVKFMADRLIIMKNGKIEEMGDADTIFSHPQTEYTKTLLQALPEKRTIEQL